METITVREHIQEDNDPFLHVTFDDETHRPLSKHRPGRKRKGKLTEEGRSALKVVKQAGGQCERCRILKRKCDGNANAPCNQCQGVNHKPGSRWFGRPCIRLHANAHTQRPLRDDLGSCNEEQTSPCREIRTSALQAGVLPFWDPDFQQYQTINDFPIQHRHQSLIRSSRSISKPNPQLTWIARTPLPNGMVLSWMNAQPYMHAEFSAQAQSQAFDTKQCSPLPNSRGSSRQVRTDHTSKINHFLEQGGGKRDENPAGTLWIFTIYSENLSPILQSLLPRDSLKTLFINPTGTLSTSQDLNSAYFRLLVFLAANDFPDMDHEGIKAILQQLRGRSPEQLETFFHSIIGPTNKALAENLYRHAVQAGEETIVDFILMSQCLGVDVNGKIDARWDSPLDSCKEPEMARIFLRHQARFRKMMTESHKNKVLRRFISTRSSRDVDTDLLRQLLNADAEVGPALLDNLLCSRNYMLFDEFIHYLPRERYSYYHKGVFFFRYIWAADYATCVQSVEHMINTQSDLNCLASLTQFDPELEDEAVVDLVTRKGHLELVRNLLRAGASLTRKSLVFAVQSGCAELVQFLIDHGADLHGYNTTGKLPLAEAILADHTRIIRLLLQNGALSFRMPWEFCLVVEATSASGNMELTRTVLAVAEQELTDRFDKSWQTLRSAGEDVQLSTAIEAGHNEIALLIIDSNMGISFANLAAAIEVRNMSIVQALLDAGVLKMDRRSRDIDSCKRTLKAALLWGDHALIEELLCRGLDVTVYQSSRRSSIEVAVQKKDTVLVKMLLDAGAIINAPALLAATKLRDVAMVQYLLQHGADAGNSEVLYEAILLDEHELVRVLLREFSRRYPHGKKGYGTAAFITALDMDDPFWMEYLIDKIDLTASEADANSYDCFSVPLYGCFSAPLKHTIERGSNLIAQDTWIRKARFLLEHGVSPQGCDYCSNRYAHTHSPLTLAVKRKNIPMISLLLEFKADINHSSTKCNFPTPLQYAAKVGDLDMVRLLVDNGAMINYPPARRAGGTVLQLAASNGHNEIVSFLLNNNADVNASPSPSEGGTALQLAAKEGHIRIVSLLLENNANVNASPSPSHGGTALQLAAIKGYIGIVSLLLAHGADINAPPSPIGGRTALDGAAEWGRLDTVKFLLDAGVDVRSDRGLRYLRVAKRRARVNGFNAIVDLLEAYHPDPGPCMEAVYTDREGWTLWAKETDEGYEAWRGEMPTTLRKST